MQVAFYLAGEITQVLDLIPWVRCDSGNVLKHLLVPQKPLNTHQYNKGLLCAGREVSYFLQCLELFPFELLSFFSYASSSRLYPCEA